MKQAGRSLLNLDDGEQNTYRQPLSQVTATIAGAQPTHLEYFALYTLPIFMVTLSETGT